MKEKWKGRHGRLAEQLGSDASLSLSEGKRKVGYKHPRPHASEGMFDKAFKESSGQSQHQRNMCFLGTGFP